MSDTKTIVEEKNDNVMYLFRNAVSSAMNQGYSAKDVFDSMKEVVASFERDAQEIAASIPAEEPVVEIPVEEISVEDVVAEDIEGGDNPLANIRSNILEFPNGEVLYVGYKDGKMFAGEATNVGVVHDFEMDYDKDSSVDINLQNFYDYITEKRPSLLQKEDEMPTLDKDDRVKEAILEEKELETYPADSFIVELPIEIQDRIMDKVESKIMKDHPDWSDAEVDSAVDDAYNSRLCDLEDTIDISSFVDDYKAPVKGKVLTETSEEDCVNLVSLINGRFGDIVAETQEKLNDSEDEDEDYDILHQFWDDLFLVTDGEISDEERDQLFFDGDDLDGDPTKVCKDILWDLFSIQNLSFESPEADEIGILDDSVEDEEAYYAADDDEVSDWFKEEE